MGGEGEGGKEFLHAVVHKPVNPLNQPFNFNVQKYNNIFFYAALFYVYDGGMGHESVAAFKG